MNTFLRRTLWVAGLAAGLAVSMISTAHAQSSRIGFVQLERILRDSVPAKAAQTKIELEFKKRDQDLQDVTNKLRGLSEKLDKESAVLSESDRLKHQRELTELDKDFQRKQREFREDLNQRKNEEIAAVLERANKVIKQIAEAEKYDIVLQEAVYASPRIDITDKVLKVLNK